MLDRQCLVELARHHPSRSAWTIVGVWVTIGAACSVAVCIDTIPIYLVAIAIIASRQHALAVLMHEAAHGMVFKNRQINDVIAELVLAHPLLVSLKLYRIHHLNHHRFLNTPEDPDLEVRVEHFTRGYWAKHFIASTFGGSIVNLFRGSAQFSLFSTCRRRGRDRLTRSERYRTLICAAIWAGALTLLDWWWYYAALWLAPLLTVTAALLRLRAVAEHTGMGSDSRLLRSRTVITNSVARAFLAPCNVGYHFEHHLYPTVPFYSLPTIHCLLTARGAARPHVTRGYVIGDGSVLGELERYALAHRDSGFR